MNKYIFEAYVTDKHFVEIYARNSHDAEDIIREMSLDDLKENSVGVKNLDVSDITLIKAEEIEEEQE